MLADVRCCNTFVTWFIWSVTLCHRGWKYRWQRARRGNRTDCNPSRPVAMRVYVCLNTQFRMKPPHIKAAIKAFSDHQRAETPEWEANFSWPTYSINCNNSTTPEHNSLNLNIRQISTFSRYFSNDTYKNIQKKKKIQEVKHLHVGCLNTWMNFLQLNVWA